MANVSGASLDGIYNRLHDVPEYHPMSANTFADWSLEAGDIVTVTRDGKSYASPTMNNTTIWRKKQQVTVNATGNEQRDTIAKMSQRKFRGGGASLRATQRAFEQIVTSYNEMSAGLVLASSTARLYVDNKYTQMRAGLDLTSSSARLYVDNKYAQMRSGLDLTSSSARLYVDNKYAQMRSGLDLTSSSAHLYVDNKYSQMKSGLDLTSSSARLYVDNKYAQMRAGLNLTSSSAMLYARERTTRAYIMTRINADGEGEALIEADKVSITGNTTLSGSVEINGQGFLVVKKTMNVAGNINLTTPNTGVGAPCFIASTNGYVRIYGASSGVHYDLTASVLASMVKTATVNNDVLTLTLFDGTVLTFSRAVSSWVWGGGDGKINVTALPQNQTKSVKVSIDGRSSITANGSYTYTVDYENGDGDDVSTGATKEVTVNVGTDKGSNWYCTVTQSGQNKSCTLTKNFSASQSVPFTNGNSYRLYTH